MKEFIKKHKFLFISFFYLSISLFLTITHEPWRDEAQQWLICRDLSLWGVIKQLKYEGHFLLWYLILFPFVKLGFPYFTQNIISWAISGAGGILFLKKAPFKFWKKVLFLFSPIMLYYLPAFSRCYCLSPLAICFICLSYQKREEKPLKYLLSIVFLVNIHTFFLIPSALLLFDYYYELGNKLGLDFLHPITSIKKLLFDSEFKHKFMTSIKEKHHIRNLLIVFALLIVSGLPLLGSLSANKLNGRGRSYIESLLEAFLGLPFTLTRLGLSFVPLSDDIYILLMFLLFFIFISMYNLNKKAFYYSLISFLYFFYLAGITVNAAGPKLAVALLLFWLFYWLYRKEFTNTNYIKEYRKIILGLLVAFCVTGINYYQYDVKYNYSSAREVADYFNKLSEDSNFLLVNGNQPQFVSSIAVYLNKGINVFSLSYDNYYSYVTWDERTFTGFTETDFLDIRNKLKLLKDVDLYYIYVPCKHGIESDTRVVADLLYDNKLSLVNIFNNSYGSDEKYWIFKINT